MGPQSRVPLKVLLQDWRRCSGGCLHQQHQRPLTRRSWFESPELQPQPRQMDARAQPRCPCWLMQAHRRAWSAACLQPRLPMTGACEQAARSRRLSRQQQESVHRQAQYGRQSRSKQCSRGERWNLPALQHQQPVVHLQLQLLLHYHVHSHRRLQLLMPSPVQAAPTRCARAQWRRESRPLQLSEIRW